MEDELLKTDNSKDSKDSKTQNDKERFIYLSGAVDEEMSKDVTEKLLEFQAKDPLDVITIILNSYGGEVDSMLAITDMMEIIISPIRTIVVGKAMSAAATIFIFGDYSMRYMTKNSRLMFHQMSSALTGTTKDVEVEVEEVLYIQKLMIEQIAERSKLTYDNVEILVNRDAYIRPEKAIEFGFCDSIIERLT